MILAVILTVILTVIVEMIETIDDGINGLADLRKQVEENGVDGNCFTYDYLIKFKEPYFKYKATLFQNADWNAQLGRLAHALYERKYFDHAYEVVSMGNSVNDVK